MDSPQSALFANLAAQSTGTTIVFWRCLLWWVFQLESKKLDSRLCVGGFAIGLVLTQSRIA